MNYTINTGNPGASFMQGAEQVANFANMQATVQAKQQEAAAMQAAAERKAYQQKRFQEVSQNPTSSATQKLLLEFPELAEQTERALKSLSATEKQSAMQIKYMVRTALKQGKPEIAIQELDRMIDAAKNSGDTAMLQKLEIEKDGLQASPNGARLVAESFLFSEMGKDYADMAAKEGEEERKQEMQPSALKKSEADAEKAAVAAKFAESQAVMDLEKSGWDIKKIQNDMQVSRQNVAIAAANAAVNRANSATAQQEAQIKLQQLVEKRDETVRTKVSEAETARAGIDNSLNTAQRILNTPLSVVGAAAGPISSRMPTISQSTSDFEASVKNLKDQVSMARIGEMKGVLTDKDMEILGNSLQSLDLRQSPEQLIRNVKEIQRLMLKSRSEISQKFGIPETVPDTPAANQGAGNIDALLEKYR